MRKALLLAALTLPTLIACSRTERAASGELKAAAASSADAPANATETVAAAGTSVGSRMPEYSAELLGGGQFDVAKERGNVVLLNVWATWCGPCRYEIPELERIHRKYAPQRFKVVGVSIDETGPEGVRDFVTNMKDMTYPVALDPQGKLAAIFETTVLPTTVLIDREGTIVWKRYGAIEAGDETLEKALDAALKQS